MKNTKNNQLKASRGITLIALVITIIVLLILAGVTIATLTGNNGILIRAQEAKNKTEESKEDELKKLTALEAATNLENETIIDNSTGKDVYVTIPAGFAISQVEGEQTVKDGLVVIDKDGNEFVWIPVDGILGENEKTVQNAVDGEIILGRYVFENEGNININLTPTSLDGNLKKDSNDSYYFTESSEGNGNATAVNIENFINSVRTYKGFYVARYEASKGSNNKLEIKYNKPVWNTITQLDASTACKNLYPTLNSDLMNSYAWDTIMLYIQKYAQNNYSMQNGKDISDSLKNTGMSGDVQLNIYDLSANCREWTTETCSSSVFPCVRRGGFYYSDDYTSVRGNLQVTYKEVYNSFRPIIYI